MKVSFLSKTLLVGTFVVTALGSAYASAMTDSEISVTGEASRQVQPTHALLNLGVINSHSSVSAAKNANDAIMSRIISNLSHLGIPKQHIQTSSIYVSPDYDYTPSNGRNEVKGYSINNSVVIRINDTEKIGKAIDAAIASGATNVNSLSFQSDVPSTLNDQLTTEAIQQARHQAEVMAAALGRTLGPVKSASVSNTRTSTIESDSGVMLLRAAALSTSTPVEKGSMVASKTANVTYTLQ